MKISRIITMAAAAASAAALIVVAGCSNQLNDQGGIKQASPDYSLTYLNADSYPNVTMLCIDGVGFATTTRDYTALVKVPEWNTFCATKERAMPQLTSRQTGDSN